MSLASSRLCCLLPALLLALAPVPEARAVLFYDTADPGHNTTAPGGAYTDSGWQYQGEFGSFLGTAIAPQYFLTAAHVGMTSTFVRTTTFTGGGSDLSYAVDFSAFGGNGYYDVPGTDLRIVKITGTFTDYAPLYEGVGELGSSIVVMGRGGPRGSAVTLGPDLKGWLHTGPDGFARWGTNQVSGLIPDAFSPVGDLLVGDFNALPGTEEMHLSTGDSGGGIFINDGGTWKLAGINYAVDGLFNTAPTNVGAFNAALFDAGGYYMGQDPSWQFNPDLPADTPSSFYASRVSSSASTIQGIVGVPEPGALMLLMAAAMLPNRRRRCHG